MSDISTVDAYWSACESFQEVCEAWDTHPDLGEMRELRQLLALCFKRLLAVAEANDTNIWYAIGNAYHTGRGTERSLPDSISWYRRAAQAGNCRAMVSLGLRLQHPDTPSTHAEAIEWFRKAADLGDAGGMAFLGFAYREGTGVTTDLNEAVRWFIQAVEAGDGHSMIHIGRLYAHYLQLPTEAVKWFLRAAEAGHSESFIELANLFSHRESKVYNPSEAHKWFRVVAEYSEGTHSRALLSIAHQFAEGQGVPCDVEMAKTWLRRLLQVVPKTSLAHRNAAEFLQKLDGQFL